MWWSWYKRQPTIFLLVWKNGKHKDAKYIITNYCCWFIKLLYYIFIVIYWKLLIKQKLPVKQHWAGFSGGILEEGTVSSAANKCYACYSPQQPCTRTTCQVGRCCY